MLLFDVEGDDFLEGLTRLWCIVAYDDELDQWYEFGPDRVEEGVDLVSNHPLSAAHNGYGYDLPAIRKLFPGAGIERRRMADTLVLSRLAYPDLDGVDWLDRDSGKRVYQTHSIEAWGHRLGVRKGSHNDFSKYDPSMLDYCRRDVEIMVELVRKIREEAPWALEERCFQIEHEFAGNIQDMMDRGAPFDMEVADEILMDVSPKRAKLHTELEKVHKGWFTSPVVKKVVGMGGVDPNQDPSVLDDYKAFRFKKRPERAPFNPGSRPQIVRYFQEEYGWKPQHFTESGNPQLDENILEALPYKEAKRFAELFQLAKLEASLSTGEKSWIKNVKEGRIHGFVCHNGTPTGRCRHSGPNLGNIPRRGEWLRCRSLFSAGPGTSLVGADASSLELVILAHYLSYWDDGEYAEVVERGDPHSHNQAAAGLKTRDQAKTFIYALLYGAGDRKIGSIVSSSDDERLLARKGRALRRKFMAAIPAFDGLVELVKGVAKSRGQLLGLDGRRIPVRSEHAALNFLCQAGGAVAMKRATNLACRKVEGMVLHVHDEMQFEVPEERADEVGQVLVESIRQVWGDLGLRCKLDAEYKVGKSWKETH